MVSAIGLHADWGRAEGDGGAHGCWGGGGAFACVGVGAIDVLGTWRGERRGENVSP